MVFLRPWHCLMLLIVGKPHDISSLNILQTPYAKCHKNIQVNIQHGHLANQSIHRSNFSTLNFKLLNKKTVDFTALRRWSRLSLNYYIQRMQRILVIVEPTCLNLLIKVAKLIFWRLTKLEISSTMFLSLIKSYI